MFESSDQGRSFSIKLAEVLEDIGVNEEMVAKRQKINRLMESIETVTDMSAGENVTVHYLGSQSEGTTTEGLHSDLDILHIQNDYNVMQELSDWKPGKINYLMKHDENVTPGYCFLQLMKSDIPHPATRARDKHHIIDSDGKILFRNTGVTGQHKGVEKQGPSNAVTGEKGHSDIDMVLALPCNSPPKSALTFLERQGIKRWQSSKKIRHLAYSGCFVVGASSKISSNPDLEWRISTSLVERSLISELNITQVQCYVLMKMMLKVFLNPRKENGLSSFMCKTVLFHCIEKTEQRIWKKNNLLSCLRYCLLELHSCVESEKCSHFLIPENNLMAGQFTPEAKGDLLIEISNIVQSEGRYLLHINIDDIGNRLQVRLNASPYAHVFPSARKLHEICFSMLFLNLAKCISKCTFCTYSCLQNMKIENLKKIMCYLTNYSENGNTIEKLASHYALPFLCSTLGSIMASNCIERNISVSTHALVWLYSGSNTDVTSGRLKLASVFYSTDDWHNTEFILKETERRYNPDTVIPICNCCSQWTPCVADEFMKKSREEDEDFIIRYMTSFCAIFVPTERKCVPRELQYEMNRSTRTDKAYINHRDKLWMPFAVIDSLPYLYFLQYKTYGHLKRYQDKQKALHNLVASIFTGKNFTHRETALNLLGQCMEQENNDRAALQCYMLSLQQRARNNAAKIHICKLLAKVSCHK